ncbi:MAG: hypothetical protein J6T98_08080, partial [Salinivirgaceae bacterium]|nr:hypothetical protein [Salinivirgaceae bacterium]
MNKTLTGITVAPLTRLFTLGLCIFAIGHAWATAPTATAVWRSNLGDSYGINGKTYAITPSGGTLNQDGTITAPTGWSSDVYAPYFDFSSVSVDNVSVLVKYSGLTLADSRTDAIAFAAIKDSAGNEVAVAVGTSSANLIAYHYGASAQGPSIVELNAVGNVSTGTGYMLFSYSPSSGVQVYMGSSIGALSGGTNTGAHWSNRTVKKLSIGGDARGLYGDACGFKIEEVALFVGSYLSNTDVSDYVFPTVIPVSLTTTDLNTITASLGSGAYFAATNTVVTYGTSDAAPSDASKTLLQGSNWGGTLWIKDQTMTEFQPGIYGNVNSTLRLSGVYCYFPQNHTCNVPVELSCEGTTRGYGMNVYDGYSRDASSNRIIKFAKIKGDGELWTSSGAGTVTMQVCDWSEFTGKFQFVNKILVLGDTVPEFNSLNTGGSIYICEGKSVRITSGKQWRADGGIRIAGELRADGVTSTTFKSDTRLTTENNGVLTLISNSDTDDLDVNYSMVGGTGTIRFEGTNYRTISRSNVPTGLICDNRLSANGFIHRVPNSTMTIGSLKGDG